MVVDGVSDVITLAPDQVKAAPEFVSTIDAQYVRGIGTAGERMLILVEIEELMAGAEMALTDRLAA